MNRNLLTVCFLALGLAACSDDPVESTTDMGTVSDLGSGDSGGELDGGADDSSVVVDLGGGDGGPPTDCPGICTFQNTCGGSGEGPDCVALCGAFDALETSSGCADELQALIDCYVEHPECESDINSDGGTAACAGMAETAIGCFSAYCGDGHSEEAGCMQLSEVFGGGGEEDAGVPVEDAGVPEDAGSPAEDAGGAE